MYGTPPRQSSLPKGRVQHTEHQRFDNTFMARVMANKDYDTTSKIEVMFLDRTSPAPIWCIDGPKPEIGDFIIVGFVNGQKNSPYCSGIITNKGWTSNFITVDKGKIRIQFPADDADVTGDPKNENDPKSHLRDDTRLASRGYVQIDSTGIKLHVPNSKPITIEAGTVNLRANTAVNIAAYDGSGTLQPVARVGDAVSFTGSGSDPQGGTVSVTGTGQITSGSSKLKSV